MMARATLVMIFIYSPQLGLRGARRACCSTPCCGSASTACSGELQRGRHPEPRAGELELHRDRAGGPELKLFNRESDREGQWLNRYADTVNANVRLGRAQISSGRSTTLIFGLENIVTVYLAAMLALDNALTVGMIFAFMAYKQHSPTRRPRWSRRRSSSACSTCISSGSRTSR